MVCTFPYFWGRKGEGARKSQGLVSCTLHMLRCSLFLLVLGALPSANSICRFFFHVIFRCSWVAFPAIQGLVWEENCKSFPNGGGAAAEGWEFPGRLNATYNESFHCTSRNRADARPARDLEHEARSGSKKLWGGTSLLAACDLFLVLTWYCVWPWGSQWEAAFSAIMTACLHSNLDLIWWRVKKTLLHWGGIMLKDIFFSRKQIYIENEYLFHSTTRKLKWKVG